MFDDYLTMLAWSLLSGFCTVAPIMVHFCGAMSKNGYSKVKIVWHILRLWAISMLGMTMIFFGGHMLVDFGFKCVDTYAFIQETPDAFHAAYRSSAQDWLVGQFVLNGYSVYSSPDSKVSWVEAAKYIVDSSHMYAALLFSAILGMVAGCFVIKYARVQCSALPSGQKTTENQGGLSISVDIEELAEDEIQKLH